MDDHRDEFLETLNAALQPGRRHQRTDSYQPADMHHDYDADTDTWRDQND